MTVDAARGDTVDQRAPVVQAVIYGNPDWVPPVINSTRVLARSGFRLNMISRDFKNQWNMSYPRTRLYRLEKRAKSSWREYLDFIVQTFRLADRSAIAVIGHDMHGFLAARLLSAVFRRPLVYHCHDYADRTRDGSAGTRFVSAFERRFARTADLVIVPDEARAQVMARDLHLNRPPLIVANAPVSAAPDAPDRLRPALAECGADFDRVVLRQGVLGPGHAIEATIRSIPLWSSRRWGFVLLGFAEQPYLDSLRALAASLGVSDQLVILPPVPYDEVPAYTRGADLGHALYDPVNVNHTHMGTASNKILEYMAAGLPLLVSDRPSFHALLDKYQCGLAADESSPESIASAVNTLLSDTAYARSMGRAGAAAFAHELSYDRQYAPVLAALSTFADHRRQVV